MNRFLAFVFIVLFIFSGATLSLAQETDFASTTTEPLLPAQFTATETTPSPLNCFDYYTFGSVSADLQSTVGESLPGATLTFTGEVLNNNAYPLLQGTLYVKIFRKDADVYSQGDGNPVVDQFVVKDGLMIPANGSLPLSYEWKVPLNAKGGEYYAAYFFATEHRYNLLGLSFTDDVVGNQAPFTIVNDDDVKLAELSKITTTLNGIDHHFAAFPLHFSSTDTVKVETTITNPSNTEKSLPLQWDQYAWDSLNPKNHRFSQTDIITLAPGETKTVTYEVKLQRESIVYITAITQDIEAKSILNIRYARDGIEETRINFPAVSAFPLPKDAEVTLFACAHSTNQPVVPGNKLTLSLKDRDGKTIHEYRYEGDITGDMGGYGETFKPASNINYALLTATLERNGVIVEQVTTEYDCRAIDSASCLPEPVGPSFMDLLKAQSTKIILALALLGVAIASTFLFMKHRCNPKNKKDEPLMTTPEE